MMNVIDQAKLAKQATLSIQHCSTQIKNNCLETIAELLLQKQEEILEANQKDCELATQYGLHNAMIDRLTLNFKRIKAMQEGVLQLKELLDPINELLSEKELENGLIIRKQTVPLGVIGIIYESRPNVTVDCATLCLKSGNVCLLKGGKEAYHTNLVLVALMKEALLLHGLDENTIQLVQNPTREETQQMMKCNQYIDVLIPRGSAALIQNVIMNATIPVIETGAGNCHIYVDEEADITMAVDILLNAKTTRPSVCNAAENCVIHSHIAESFLKVAIPALTKAGVTLVGCEKIQALYPQISLATEEDYAYEFLDLKLALKITDTLDEALAFIAKYSTHHSEAIITRNATTANQFMNEIDAAAVYHNASTRFTDGFEFGLGAEIGISTQKLHARGPMGLRELCSYKYKIIGNGQTRR